MWKYLKNMAPDAIIDSSNVDHFKTLWADAGIQQTYDNRSSYQLTDSASYFFERLDAIAEESYLPNEQDVLRSRVRRNG